MGISTAGTKKSPSRRARKVHSHSLLEHRQVTIVLGPLPFKYGVGIARCAFRPGMWVIRVRALGIDRGALSIADESQFLLVVAKTREVGR